MNKRKQTILLTIISSILFFGCASNKTYITDYEITIYHQKASAKRMASSVEEYKELKEKKKKEENLKRLSKYEKDYFNEFQQIKNNLPKINIKWVQPNNKNQPCKIYVAYYKEDPTEDNSFKLYWDGQCKNGYAHGLGREFNIADVTNVWQIAIYKKGKPKNYAVINDILYEFTLEGECKYDENNYQVKRYVSHKNNDTSITYNIGKFGDKKPDTIIQTSPFANNTMRYLKTYPNFRYQYIDSTNNDVSKIDFSFTIFDKNNKKNGWAIEKSKNKNIIYSEYINNKRSKVNLPQIYIDKGNRIIDEIKSSYNKALKAQAQAQLIKKQYIRKICKKTVKVNFMDNDEYKEICSSQYEKNLWIMMNMKLDMMYF